MLMIARRKPVYGLLILSLFLVMTIACVTTAPAAPTQEIPKTILVTQMVTQVVITPTPEATETPIPTFTPLPSPTATATFNPYAVPIYYPLKDCVASRLHVGDVAMVSPGGTANGIRFGLDLSEENIVDYAQPGTLFVIIGGPYCSRGWIVWEIQMKNGLIGYTPEGNGSEYWLLPTR
jgi:hypothetical protein